MKRLLVLFMLSIVTCANAQSSLTLSEAKEIANTFYGSLQQIAKHPYGDIRIANERRLFGVMGVDENGHTIAGRGEVPNDLVGLEGKQVEDNRPIQIRSYITRFLRIAEEKKMDFSYKVLSNDYQYGPEIKKTDETPLFARVVVQKTIKSSSFPMTQINDTMLINTRNRAIWITNKYRKSSGSNYENKTIDELLAEAQSMYSNRRYDEAYKLYQKALEKDPTNAEVSYSLGVMSFKGEGCKQYPRKVRDYLAEFYWLKCVLYPTNIYSAKGVDALTKYVGSIFHYNYLDRCYSGYETNPFPSNRMLACNVKNEKWGYISKQGKMDVEQQFRIAFPFFDNGTTVVNTEKDEWLLIDTMGKIKDSYEKVDDNKIQLLVHKDGISGVINRKTGGWDIPFANLITKPVWYNQKPICYVNSMNGKVGLVSTDNVQILPIMFNNIDLVGYWYNGTIWVLCDYDELALGQLEKEFGFGKIPEEDLRKIGTLYKLQLK